MLRYVGLCCNSGARSRAALHHVALLLQQVRTVYNDSFLSLQGALRRRSARLGSARLGSAWLGLARLGLAGGSRPADTAATAVCAAEKVSLPIQRQPLRL